MKNKVFSIGLAFFLATHLIGQVELIDFGTQWKYYDLGHEPFIQYGIRWYETSYDDQEWASGKGQLGYGEDDEATDLNTSANTLYFRYSFLIIDPAVLDSLFLQLAYDDGAIVYLNNEEIWRLNMPPGDVYYHTNASSESPANSMASKFENNVLQSGTNVISVAIHQHNNSSSNASFDLKLVGTSDGSTNLDRGPYLQKASPHSMTVKWRNVIPTDAFLLYGTQQDSLTELVFDLEVKTDQELVVNNLMADTRYYYAIADANGFIVEPDPSIYFETSPSNGSEQLVRAWILGDSGTGNDDQRAVRDAYYQHIGEEHTDMILFLGDNAYTDGSDAEYQNSLFENMYESILRNTVAWSCLGDQDGHSANSETQTGPYYEIFSFPTNAESGGIASETEAYYSFDYGNMHFISLDSYESDRTIGGSMYNWCLADIQNTTADWIIAFWHHPPYSKGSNDSDEETPQKEMRQNFLPMLEDNGVDLVLSGHSNSYERSYFLNEHYQSSESFDTATHIIGTNGYGNGQISGNGPYQKSEAVFGPVPGTVYVTAGSSGKVSSGPLNHPAMYYSVSELGSCLLETEGNELTLKFIRENGEVGDYFTIQKGNDCVVNESCNDGDACTVDDKINEDCLCEGIFNDGDQDEICDAYDQCPDLHNELIGTACDDQDPCTIEDHYTENCECVGVYLDSDQDGVCDNFDECPTLPDSLIGTPCDDLLACTVDDQYTSLCDCVGTYIDSDQDGVCDEEDICHGLDDSLIGTACDDQDPCTIEDHYTENCACVGVYLDSDQDGVCDNFDECPTLPDSLIGTPCDDLLACTVDDQYTSLCDCVGTYIDSDQDGVCDEEDICHGLDDSLIGTACDDQDPCTIEDHYTENCACVGVYLDSDQDGVCDNFDECPTLPDSLIGTPCDDLLACTVDDQYTSLCDCVGTYIDSDQDGVCDEEDICHGLDDSLIGTACDDQDPCTIEDHYTENCECVGVYLDSDQDGVCDRFDICPTLPDSLIGTPCDDLLACTVDDQYTSLCNCVGSFIDSDQDGICDEEDICPGLDDTLIGTACDDLNPCTIEDHYTENCACVGIEIDSDDDGICDSEDPCPHLDNSLIGTPCDDGDACTIDDIYTEDCRCNGIFLDTDQDGICDDEDRCPGLNDDLIGTECDDQDECTIEDRYDEDCICRGILSDRDEDGICDEDDDCPDLHADLIGTPCDDGDPCTTDDLYRSNCGCIGAYRDSDNDGVCDEFDRCEGQDDELIGKPCNDQNECTLEDIFTEECQCVGIYIDKDEDGFCYGIDPNDDDPCIPDVTAETCQPCGPLYFDSFENGMGNWIDGGRDCARISGNANSGLHSVRIRDNSGPSSSLYTKVLDLTNYKIITIRFVYFPIGMDANEDFFLEISLDGGEHFEKVRTWIKGRDFENNKRYHETIEIDDFVFSKTTVFRIRCDASGNNDQVYVDDIEIASCRATCVPGALCDDKDDCTELDTYDDDCNCRGIVIDSDKDGICDLFDRCPNLNDTLIGSPCDDEDDCTIDDIYTDECHCIGRIADEDEDGICDAEDRCPELNDDLIGQPCNDGQECTKDDRYTIECRCIGTFSDEDNDGICDEEDECPGQHDGLIGASCDDGDPCTVDDIYSDDCWCIGRFTDFDGDGICVGEDPDDRDPCNPNEQALTCGSCPDYDSQSFENDLGLWNDGGSDCARVRLNAHDGVYSMRLRDNSGSKSSMFTDPIDFTDYEEVHVTFSFYSVGMEEDEDFFLEISSNGGSTFTTIAKWTIGSDFINNTRYFENRTIDEDLLSSETVIRIRCDASNNSDQVYIDAIKLSACIKSAESQSTNDKGITKARKALLSKTISVSPNPSSSQIYISTKLENAHPAKVTITNLNGREMAHFIISKGSDGLHEIDVSQWPAGIYFVFLSANDKPLTYQKIIVVR